MSTLYASFVDASAAEKATGALLDEGATAADISIVANEAYDSARSESGKDEASRAEHSAKTGISTTTGADAAAGAVTGTGIGIGVAALAVLGSILVPGIGLVIGGGTLALALAGGAATVVAGGATGAIVGYLKDQGVPEEVATRYSTDFLQGGAILAISVPTGSLTAIEAEALLSKYGATNIATYYSNRTMISDPALQQSQVPIVLNNPDADPVVTNVVVAENVAPRVTRVIDAQTGESRVVANNMETVIIDPISGMPVAPIEQIVVAEEEPLIDTKRSDVELY